MVLIVHQVVQGLKSQTSLLECVATHLKVPISAVKSVNVVRRSIDARKRGRLPVINFVYKVHADLVSEAYEKEILANNIQSFVEPLLEHESFQPSKIRDPPSLRPIIIGSGPAGLFAAYTMASSGLKPILIEQGPKVERRAKDLMRFWKENELTESSNGVFGEGGAGTFSDGKLTTRTSSPYHRFVHEVLIKYGAKPNILYESRAHVGTDQLRKIITKFSREAISGNHGTIMYNTKVEDLILSKDGAVAGVRIQKNPLMSVEEQEEWQRVFDSLANDGIINVDGANCSNAPPGDSNSSSLHHNLKSSAVFLASGHSSRSIFRTLHKTGVSLSQQNFAIGLRLQISQKYINKLQFGNFAGDKALGPAEFSLKYFDTETKRSVYTFCMCPGGVIVNASHGNNEVAVNGMSYSTRASRFANAAFVVTVNGTDFDDSGSLDPGHPLAGVNFQEHWERKCFEIAGGDYSAPAQRVVDYINRVDHSANPQAPPLPDHIFMGKLTHANLHKVLPDVVNKALVNALKHFSRNIPGLVDPEALLVGIESRTSSPVRITRDSHTLESTNTKGLYPMGEGAGYAGGIMTACVDGVRCAEAFIAMCNGDLQSVPRYEMINNELVASKSSPSDSDTEKEKKRTGTGTESESVFKYPSW